MSSDLDAFRLHMEQNGYPPDRAADAVTLVKRFLKFAGNKRADRITADETRQFFLQFKNTDTKSNYASVITKYVKFATAGLPVVVNSAGAAMPPVPLKPNKKELALRVKWGLEKLLNEKEAADELIAKLAKRVIADYLYFQSRQRGGDEDLDEVSRLAAESQEIIQANLALFMGLSAAGHNIHSRVDERVQK